MEGQAEVAIGYGLFIQTLVNFMIVAWALFLLVKGMNKLQRQKAAEPPPPAPPTEEVLLLRDIRDSLKK